THTLVGEPYPPKGPEPIHPDVLFWRLNQAALSLSVIVFPTSPDPSEVKIKPPHYYLAAALVSLLGFLLLATACRTGDKLPAKSSKEYNEVVRAFYIGLAALQVGDDVRADSKLAQLTQLIP